MPDFQVYYDIRYYNGVMTVCGADSLEDAIDKVEKMPFDQLMTHMNNVALDVEGGEEITEDR